MIRLPRQYFTLALKGRPSIAFIRYSKQCLFSSFNYAKLENNEDNHTMNEIDHDSNEYDHGTGHKSSNTSSSNNRYSGSIPSAQTHSSSSQHPRLLTNADMHDTKTKNDIPYKFLDPKTSQKYPITSFPLNSITREILIERGIQELFPVQGETYHEILLGKNVIGRARTGTGKTLGFGLPLIDKVFQLYEDKQSLRNGKPKVLIITPTRELCLQVSKELEAFGPQFKNICCYGGHGNLNTQLRALRSGVDFVIGTPGRLIDLIQRNALALEEIGALVLDEADHMLDLGFKEDIEFILGALPKDYQKVMFSATMPPSILSLAKGYFRTDTRDAIYIDAVGESKLRASENIKMIAIPTKFTSDTEVGALVAETIKSFDVSRAIIFVERRDQAQSLLPHIQHDSVAMLHGGMSQSARESVLANFKNKLIHAIVATDVAGRGLDIADVDLVIQVGVTKNEESFIHRAGRTARAGKGGVNVVLFDPTTDSKALKQIEREVGCRFVIQTVESRPCFPLCPNSLYQKLLTVSENDKEKLHVMTKGLLKALKESHLSLEHVLPSLLALLHLNGGFGRPSPKSSLISGKKGFVTFEWRLEMPRTNSTKGTDSAEGFHLLTGTSSQSVTVDRVISYLLSKCKLLSAEDIHYPQFSSNEKNVIIFDIPESKAEALNKIAEEVEDIVDVGELISPTCLHDFPAVYNSNTGMHGFARPPNMQQSHNASDFNRHAGGSQRPRKYFERTHSHQNNSYYGQLGGGHAKTSSSNHTNNPQRGNFNRSHRNHHDKDRMNMF